MATSGGTGRATRTRRAARLVVPLALAGLLVALVGTNLRLRDDTQRAIDTTSGRRAELAEAHDRLDALAAEQERLADRRDDVERALREAEDRLRSLTADEDDLARRLDERVETRTETDARLDIVATNVDEVTDQTRANEILIAALDRCLDGATEAANALSVGDVRRAFASTATVRDDCRTVGIAIG